MKKNNEENDRTKCPPVKGRPNCHAPKVGGKHADPTSASCKETCPACNKKMEEVYDEVAKKFTGHQWKCNECNPDLTVSVG